MKKSNLLYLAGILDGEGHFHRPYHVNGRGERRLQARVIVTNTNYELIQWLKENFGGTIYMRKRKRKPHHLDCWEWRLFGKKATVLAKQLVPYLIVKREQVKSVL